MKQHRTRPFVIAGATSTFDGIMVTTLAEHPMIHRTVLYILIPYLVFSTSRIADSFLSFFNAC
jgi:hypothetical protein